jgi:hypothetical protein
MAVSPQQFGMNMALGIDSRPFIQDSRRVVTQMGQIRRSMLGASTAAGQMNIQLFSMGFIATVGLRNAAQTAADFEMEILRASQATMQGADQVKRLAGESKALSRTLKANVLDVAALQKSVARMGIDTVVPGSANVAKLEGNLTQAATALALVADVAEEDAGKSLFRLALTTGRTNEETAHLIENSMGLASAIVTLGDSISAGIPEYMKMVQEMQQLGIVSNLSTAEILAMSAAFAQIDPTKAGRITSGMVRLFSTEFATNAGTVARFMGITRSEMEAMQRDRPFEFFQQFTGALVEAGRAGEDLPRVIRDMGFGNVRDQRNLAIYIGMQEQVPELLRRAEEQMQSQAEIVQRVNDLLFTMTRMWDGLRASFQRAGIGVMQHLMPPLKALTAVLTGLVDIVASNRFAQVITAMGALGLIGATVGRAGAFALGALTQTRGFGGGPFGLLFAASGRNMAGVTRATRKGSRGLGTPFFGGGGGPGGGFGGMVNVGGRWVPSAAISQGARSAAARGGTIQEMAQQMGPGFGPAEIAMMMATGALIVDPITGQIRARRGRLHSGVALRRTPLDDVASARRAMRPDQARAAARLGAFIRRTNEAAARGEPVRFPAGHPRAGQFMSSRGAAIRLGQLRAEERRARQAIVDQEMHMMGMHGLGGELPPTGPGRIDPLSALLGLEAARFMGSRRFHGRGRNRTPTMMTRMRFVRLALVKRGVSFQRAMARQADPATLNRVARMGRTGMMAGAFSFMASPSFKRSQGIASKADDIVSALGAGGRRVAAAGRQGFDWGSAAFMAAMASPMLKGFMPRGGGWRRTIPAMMGTAMALPFRLAGGAAKLGARGATALPRWVMRKERDRILQDRAARTRKITGGRVLGTAGEARPNWLWHQGDRNTPIVSRVASRLRQREAFGDERARRLLFRGGGPEARMDQRHRFNMAGTGAAALRGNIMSHRPTARLAQNLERTATGGKFSAMDAMWLTMMMGPRMMGRGVKGAGKGTKFAMGAAGRFIGSVPGRMRDAREARAIRKSMGPLFAGTSARQTAVGNVFAGAGRWFAGRNMMQAAGMAAPHALGRGAAMALGGGPIGAAIALIGAATPLFRELGSLMQHVGQGSGPIALLANMLGTVFRTLQLIGNLINTIFGWLWDILKKIFGLVYRYTGTEWLHGQMNKGFRQGNQFLEDANVRLGGEGQRGRLSVHIHNNGTDAQAESAAMLVRSVRGGGSGVI